MEKFEKNGRENLQKIFAWGINNNSEYTSLQNMHVQLP